MYFKLIKLEEFVVFSSDREVKQYLPNIKGTFGKTITVFLSNSSKFNLEAAVITDSKYNAIISIQDSNLSALVATIVITTNNKSNANISILDLETSLWDSSISRLKITIVNNDLNSNQL